jgi:hypothetical protein
MNKFLFRISKVTLWVVAGVFPGMFVSALADANHGIRPYSGNPYYWEYKGKPTLLLGGSEQDNLFNHPEGLAAQLDTLMNSGGNYIRNTMSSRNPGNIWPFRQLENGLYDLEQWNEEYWARFEQLLVLCSERDIIVQIELWDPHDYFRREGDRGIGDNNGWELCPYNPRLNINYTAEESQLAETIEFYHTRRPTRHNFFYTPPTMKDIPVVRRFQEDFVNKIMSISLRFSNVIYCINNEIAEPPEWGIYWAKHIRALAEKEGKQVYLSDMRRISNLSSTEQINLMLDREHYDFFDMSQNNLRTGQTHYDQIISVRNRVADNPIPINNNKIYGGRQNWTGGIEEGGRRFWRNVFGGGASARFHRPGEPNADSPHPRYGIGGEPLSYTHIRGMRMFTDAMDLYRTMPRNDLLSDRSENEAYCLAEPGRQYAVYFPDGGTVTLAVGKTEGRFQLRWLEISQSAWSEPQTVDDGGPIELRAPGLGGWAALIHTQNSR